MNRVADNSVSAATVKQRKSHTLYIREYRKCRSEAYLDADRKTITNNYDTMKIFQIVMFER